MTHCGALFPLSSFVTNLRFLLLRWSSTCHLVTNQPTANLSPVCNGSGQVTVMRAAEVSLGVQSSLLSIEASCCSSDISSCPPSQIQIVSKLAYLHTNNVRDYKNGPFYLIHAQNPGRVGIFEPCICFKWICLNFEMYLSIVTASHWLGSSLPSLSSYFVQFLH